MKDNLAFLDALQQIAKDKGISVDVLLDALANALVAAYKRMPGAAEEAVVTIEADSGEIRVYGQELDEEGAVVREWDDTPKDFGRIAAQTAKQVIFQRIREAERDLKYEEYAGREGDIVTGIIQQSDNRYTLLDLGKVEALLPQAEQVPVRALRAQRTAQGLHRRSAQDEQGATDRRFSDPPGPHQAPVRTRSAGDRERHRRNQGRRAGAGSPDQDRCVVQRPQRRSSWSLRRCSRSPGPHGDHRAPRREGGHRPLLR